MKNQITLLLVTSVVILNAQNEKLSKLLPKGPHQVGFQLIEQWDHSRTYQFDSGDIPWRPMQVAVWFPAGKKENVALTYKDYIDLSSRSETLTANDSLKEQKWKELINAGHINKELLIESFSSSLLASTETFPTSGNYPLVLYAPGSSSHWYENVLLFERLASYGYVVMAIKSRGHKSPLMSMNWEGAESQTRDLEFLQALAYQYTFIDVNRIHIVGRSWGAIAAAVFSIRNQSAKSITSMDGTLSYNAMLLMESSPYPGGAYLNVPILLQVGKNRSKDATPIDRKNYFLDVKFADAFSIEYTHLSHVAFSSYHLLYYYLCNKQLNEETKSILLNGYVASVKHLIQFLNAQEKGEPFQLISNNEYVFDFQKANSNKLPDYNDFSFALETKGWPAAKQLIHQIEALSPDYNFGDLVSPSYLNSYAYRLHQIQQTAQGTDVLTTATRLFPQNANLFDSLGELHYHQGNWSKAIKNYQQSILLHPENNNAVKMIEQIDAIMKKE
ncbi:MAG: hypothetical protein AAFO07_04990 [Bacteroidota bacterium]